MDRVLKKLKFPEVEYQIKENANLEYGELYTNIPFMLSKSLKKNPMDIASDIQKELSFDQ